MSTLFGQTFIACRLINVLNRLPSRLQASIQFNTLTRLTLTHYPYSSVRLLSAFIGFAHGPECTIVFIVLLIECAMYWIALLLLRYFPYRSSLKQDGSRNLRKGVARPFPTLSFPFYSPFPLSLHFPSPLRVGLLKPARGLGSAVSSPCGVRGKAPTENEFGAL